MGIPPTAKAGKVKQQGDAFPDVFNQATVTTSSAVRARHPHTNTNTLPSFPPPSTPALTHTMGMGAGRIAAGCSRSLIMLPHVRMLPTPPRTPGCRPLTLGPQTPSTMHTSTLFQPFANSLPSHTLPALSFLERLLPLPSLNVHSHIHARMHAHTHAHACIFTRTN